MDILDAGPNPKSAPKVLAAKLERDYARELRERSGGDCMNYPACGCKIQYGYDCIPF